MLSPRHQSPLNQSGSGSGEAGPQGPTGPQGPGYLFDSPSKHNAIEWNFDPILSGSAAGQPSTTGTIYMVKITPQVGGTISNIIVGCGTTAPASALTASQNFAAIYDSTGARIAITNDQTTAWATSGAKTMPLVSPVALTANQDYYVAILSNSSGGTAGVFIRSNSGAVTIPNFGFATTATYRFATNGTSQTSLPSTITLSSNAGSGAQPWWVALS